MEIHTPIVSELKPSASSVLKMVMAPAANSTPPQPKLKDNLTSTHNSSSSVAVPIINNNNNNKMVKLTFEKVREEVVRRLHKPWGTRQVKFSRGEWRKIKRSSRGFDTQSLMISCGTVTMDKAGSSSDRKVLLVWNKKVGVWQLPKGRKDLHEDLSACALRETTEETGVAVKPLYLRFGSRFTVPTDTTTGNENEKVAGTLRKRVCKTHNDDGSIVVNNNNNGIVNVLNKDIFYVTVYPDPATRAMRHVYWYAAKPEHDTLGQRELMTKEDIEKMTMKWFPAAEAVEKLKMSIEREAVALAVYYAEQMTDEEWAYSQKL